jgi:hypothetical protein
MDMLVEVLNKMDDIHFIHVSNKYFYNYDKMLNSLCKNFRGGTIQKKRYFVVNCDLPTIMISKSYINDDAETSFDFYKKTPHREVLLQTYILEELNAPGIREIKQVELWKNWRQYIPHPHKDLICPEPPQEIIERIKKEKSNKVKEKTQKRKRDSTRNKK